MSFAAGASRRGVVLRLRHGFAAGAGRRGGDVPSALAGTSEPPDPPIDSGGGMACMPRPSDLYQTRTVVDAIVEAYDAEDRSARPWLFKNTYGNLKGSS